MRAAKKKSVDNIKILQDFVPLNALSDERFNEIAEKITIDVVRAGRDLFRRGDRDNRTIYLLEGKVSFIDEHRKVTGEIVAGTDASRHPLINQQPRPVSARVVEKAVIATIDSGLLDVFLTWDQSNTADAVDLDVEEAGDWMTRLLQSETFRKLPPSKLQGLLVRMKPFPVAQGDVVISQGGEGDYFYTIHEGRCRVTRKNDDGTEQQLAELGEGDSFGEEALVSDARRNATITMLTNGHLMRLAKEDFDELLKTQLLRYIDYKTAAAMVADGAVWLDVRTPDEYESGAFEDSVNLPLASLRGELPELVFNSNYILCCDTGRRSDSAAFILSHKGYSVYVLEGGMSALMSDGKLQGPANDASAAELPGLAASTAPVAELDADDKAAAVTTQDKALREANASLSDELAAERAAVSRMSGQIEQLRGELGESVEKLGELQKHSGRAAEEKHQLERQLEALQEEQASQLHALREELAAAQQECASLQEQHAGTHPEAAADPQLSDDLAAARERIAVLESELKEAAGSGAGAVDEAEAALQSLQAENNRLTERIVTLEATTTNLQGKLDAANEQESGRVRERDAQTSASNEMLQQLRTELAAAYVSRDQLKVDNRELQDRIAKAEKQLQEQTESREMNDNVLAGLRAEHETDQAALEKQLEAERQSNEDLRLRLKRSDSRTQEQVAQSTEQQQALADQLEALQSSTQEELAALQAQLEAEQQRSLAAGQQLEERDDRIASLEQAAADAEVARISLEEQGVLQQQQLDDAQGMLQQREEHARQLESEYTESLSKSHDELTRKNDTEKELQGQIDRLRKKLEQISQDNQKSRESSLDDLDSLREELHHERQARAEERAQMAARQRELKEQLAAIAVQHEANMTDQSGAIEQARDAAREEERSRLQSMLDSHAETEERLVRVQAELQQAHEEIAVLDQQEKARRQAEIDAVQEQNGQAEAAITQLETQLRQLTRERDDALNEQHDLRVKMNTLRGEVEVARGLMTAGGSGRLQDPQQLRAELDEARKNVAIAVRLRAESEATRDRMAAEVKRLRGAADGGADEEKPLYVPSLDSFDPAAGQLTAQPAPQPAPEPLLPESFMRAGHAVSAREKDSRGMHPVLKAAFVLLLAAITAVAAWFMTGSGVVNIDQTDVVITDPGMPDSVAGDGERPYASPDIEAGVSIPGESGGGVGAVPAIVAPPAQPEPVTVPADPVATTADTPDDAVQQQVEFVGTQPLRLEQPPLPETLFPGQDALIPLKPAGPPPVGRAFRDVLKGGGKGPAMIELDAAEFEMGSSGNSLNFDEGPRHTVRLPAFSMSKREITFAEFDRFARATGRRLPYDEGWGRGKRPVINVTWQDAVAYTRWLSAQTGKKYRLPSEAEWEYAARAGSDYSYWWTDTRGNIHANCFNCGSQWDGTSTAPVASFEANRYGLFDMSGNVQEWVEDCYHNNYAGAPADGSAWLTSQCQQRVVRGGAYSSPLDSLRSARRAQLSQDTRLDNLGFRVVRAE